MGGWVGGEMGGRVGWWVVGWLADAPLVCPSKGTPCRVHPFSLPCPACADVLGGILGALKSIVAVIGMTRMTPPIKDLLPRLTPILKNRRAPLPDCLLAAARLACLPACCLPDLTLHAPNTAPPTPSTPPHCALRHERVQENCIDLVGRIADRGAEFVPAREWMRICFELLDMLNVSAQRLLVLRAF